MLDSLDRIATLIGKHGVPITVCVSGIVTLVMIVRQVWLPRLKAQSTLKTRKEEAEFERQERVAEMDVEHAAKMQQLHEEERKAAIELTKVVQKGVQSIKASQDQLVNPIQDLIVLLEKLISAHEDWQVGWQFETVTIKRAMLALLACAHGQKLIDDTGYQSISDVIQSGIRSDPR